MYKRQPEAHAGEGGTGDSDGDDTPPPAAPCTPIAARSGPHGGIVLELLAAGEARTLPQKVRPPAGIQAIALTSGVWAAPLEDGVLGRPPSRHPERRRAHLTVVVGAEGDRDGLDVSVLRYSDGSPTVLRGGMGVLHQRMLRCWSRRPEARPADLRPPRAA